MKNYFNFKDKIKQELRSSLVYNSKCNSCNAEYTGKTKHHYRMRTSEHIDVINVMNRSMLCKHISLSCAKVYLTLKYHK